MHVHSAGIGYFLSAFIVVLWVGGGGGSGGQLRIMETGTIRNPMEVC